MNLLVIAPFLLRAVFTPWRPVLPTLYAKQRGTTGNNAHVDSLLTHVPGFVASQRFRKADRNDGEYFGLHTLSTGLVLLHPAYTARGGTFPPEWLPLITDWYRAFYTGLDHYPELEKAPSLWSPIEHARTWRRWTLTSNGSAALR